MLCFTIYVYIYVIYISWFVSKEEAHFIRNAQEEGLTVATQGKTVKKANVTLCEYPWIEVFSHMAPYVIIMQHFACNWIYYTLMTWLPTYYKDLFNLDVKTSGFLYCLPYVCLAVTTNVLGILYYIYIYTYVYVYIYICVYIILFKRYKII